MRESISSSRLGTAADRRPTVADVRLLLPAFVHVRDADSVAAHTVAPDAGARMFAANSAHQLRALLGLAHTSLHLFKKLVLFWCCSRRATSTTGRRFLWAHASSSAGDFPAFLASVLWPLAGHFLALESVRTIFL